MCGSGVQNHRYVFNEDTQEWEYVRLTTQLPNPLVQPVTYPERVDEDGNTYILLEPTVEAYHLMLDAIRGTSPYARGGMFDDHSEFDEDEMTFELLEDHNEDEDTFSLTDTGESFLTMFGGYIGLDSLEDLS